MANQPKNGQVNVPAESAATTTEQERINLLSGLNDEQRQEVWQLLTTLEAQHQAEQAATRDANTLANLTPGGKERLKMFLEAERHPNYLDRNIEGFCEQVARQVLAGLVDSEARESILKDDSYEWFGAYIAWHVQAAFASEDIDLLGARWYIERVEGVEKPEAAQQAEAGA